MAADQIPLRFTIEGMDCAEEVTLLKRELGPLVGGEDRLGFDPLAATMTVTNSPPEVSEAQIIGAVSGLGMRAVPQSDGADQASRKGERSRNQYTWSTAASGFFAALAFGFHVFWSGGLRQAIGTEGAGGAAPVPPAVQLLYSFGILAGTWLVLPKAWLALKRFRPDMNLLMTVAILGAIALGEWFEGATVAFLFSLSLALESWSVGRARRAVEALLELSPTMALYKKEDGKVITVPPAEVPVGGVFVVNPGERLPLDGEVILGKSHVNQAPITGESAPVAKAPGDAVYAGTVNGDGTLEVRVTKRAGESTLAHIIRLVGDAQAKRAPSEQWVEKFARVYTPTVFGLAVAFAVLPPLVTSDWQTWFRHALILLVIACPCALVISTPVTIVAALAGAARQGVLIKGGLHVETPAAIRAIAFDKTGTLTEGNPRVLEVYPLNGHQEHEVLERAASLEEGSSHPLAKAVLEFAKEKGVKADPAGEYRIIPGKGAAGRIRGREFWLGSHRFLEEKGMETPEVHEKITALSGVGRSVVVIGNEAHVCGFLAVADAVRASARDVILDLKRSGVESVVMLSGDNRGTAEAVGKETGVDIVRAELLPADKVIAVEELVQKFGTVGMVGDGVNDAPALARASVGIAMGAIGSDAAIETSDIALMSDDLSKLPWLIRHSKRAVGIIRQNITFSLAVKAVFVILTFTEYGSMWAAIAADTGASLLVISNGLRLLRD